MADLFAAGNIAAGPVAAEMFCAAVDAPIVPAHSEHLLEQKSF